MVSHDLQKLTDSFKLVYSLSISKLNRLKSIKVVSFNNTINCFYMHFTDYKTFIVVIRLLWLTL